MSEQAPMPQQPEQPVDYLQEHPNAVVDPVKAETMAYASKDSEEMFTVMTSLSKPLDPKYNSPERVAEDWQDTRHYAEWAREARAKADMEAAKAAKDYDKTMRRKN